MICADHPKEESNIWVLAQNPKTCPNAPLSPASTCEREVYPGSGSPTMVISASGMGSTHHSVNNERPFNFSEIPSLIPDSVLRCKKSSVPWNTHRSYIYTEPIALDTATISTVEQGKRGAIQCAAPSVTFCSSQAEMPNARRDIKHNALPGVPTPIKNLETDTGVTFASVVEAFFQSQRRHLLENAIAAAAQAQRVCLLEHAAAASAAYLQHRRWDKRPHTHKRTAGMPSHEAAWSEAESRGVTFMAFAPGEDECGWPSGLYSKGYAAIISYIA